jgi:hypothetical protein
MNFSGTCRLAVLNVCIFMNCFAQQSDSFRLNGQAIPEASQSVPLKETAVKKTPLVYPPATKDFRKLAINTSIFVGSSVIAFGILYACPSDVSGWNKNQIEMNTLFRRWNEHVSAGPVMDKDNFFFNYVTHPYCGGVYYITARSCGFSRFGSFLYCTAMSTFFWEYGVEAFAEVPSYQDMVITPVIGSLVGEGFFCAKKEILKHDKRVLHSKVLGVASLLLMDPFNTILDGFGYKQKVKTQVTVSPAVLNNGTGKSYLKLSLAAGF